jgi:hypothetical protein
MRGKKAVLPNPYDRPRTRSTEGMQQQQEFVLVLEELAALRMQVDKLVGVVASLDEHTRKTHDEVCRQMTRELPCDSSDTKLLVESIENVQKLQQAQDAMLATIVKLFEQHRPEKRLRLNLADGDDDDVF